MRRAAPLHGAGRGCGGDGCAGGRVSGAGRGASSLAARSAGGEWTGTADAYPTSVGFRVLLVASFLDASHVSNVTATAVIGPPAEDVGKDLPADRRDSDGSRCAMFWPPVDGCFTKTLNPKDIYVPLHCQSAATKLLSLYLPLDSIGVRLDRLPRRSPLVADRPGIPLGRRTPDSKVDLTHPGTHPLHKPSNLGPQRQTKI